MNYTKKSFQVNAPGTQEYADRWEQTFRGKTDVDQNANYPGTITLADLTLCLNCGAAKDAEGYCSVRCFLSST